MLHLVTSALNCVMNFLCSLNTSVRGRYSDRADRTEFQATSSEARTRRAYQPLNHVSPHSGSPPHQNERTLCNTGGTLPHSIVRRPQAHVSNDGTRDSGQHSHLRLEKLMMIHKPVDLSDEVTIPDPDYRKAAKGGLADVYAGIHNGERVAVKVFRISKGRNASVEASNRRRVRREMEWCRHGNSHEYLDKYRSDLSIQARVRLAQDVCEGLQYLHRLKVIHGDIKPKNVLVDENGVAKLCDFGLVRLVDWEGPAGMTTTSPYTGTALYKAPELFISSHNRLPVATFHGDIYSIGCIMLEFVEQLYPFQRFQGSQELGDAIMERLPPALREQTSHILSESTGYFWNLLEACWDEPSDRPAICTVVDTLNYLADAVACSHGGETSVDDESNGRSHR